MWPRSLLPPQAHSLRRVRLQGVRGEAAISKLTGLARHTKCFSCGAEGHRPCVHVKTGKPLRGQHANRVWVASEKILDMQTEHIEVRHARGPEAVQGELLTEEYWGEW